MPTLVLEEQRHAAPPIQNSRGRFTRTDYRALDVDDHYWYELINGELVKKSAPSPLHQLVSIKLSSLMHRFAVEHQLGVVLCAPVDVYVDDENVPQPDVLFIAQSNKNIITDEGIIGSPNLVVEILSPSSVKRDRSQKMHLYQRLVVPEYWIIDPRSQTLEIYLLQSEAEDNNNKIYDLDSYAVEAGVLVSAQLVGFSFDVAEIFR
jgi:Uma2 family endonuclease